MHWTEPAKAHNSNAAADQLWTGAALKRSQRTPTSIVRLIVEILEPYHGRILDPAIGSGGMFIQSARFMEAHQKNPASEISVHSQPRPMRISSRHAAAWSPESSGMVSGNSKKLSSLPSYTRGGDQLGQQPSP